MKRIACLVTFAVMFLGLAAKEAAAKSKVSGYLYRTPGLCYTATQSFDLGDTDRLSLITTTSTGTYANVSFTEGVRSTATITVGSAFAQLAPSTASVTITVASNTTNALDAAVITINGHPFTNGIEWSRGVTSTVTATNLAAAIALYDGLTATTTGGTIVTSSATAFGTFANAYTITSSTPAALSLSAATYTGGRDRGTVTINGTVLTAEVDFAVGASTAAAATNIAAAINANTSLNTIVVATAAAPCGQFINSCGIVFSTATATGVNAYSLSTSSRPILTPSGAIYQFGSASDITSGTNLITKTHTYPLGQGVFISTTANVGPVTGLVWGTTYFVIPVQYGTSFQLATTLANAQAGTAIDISSSPAGGATLTLNASPFTTDVNTGFAWQASNDNANWWTLPSISSVTTVGLSGQNKTGWDFGNWNYRWLRLNFTGPTRGCAVIDAAIEGKDFSF